MANRSVCGRMSFVTIRGRSPSGGVNMDSVVSMRDLLLTATGYRVSTVFEAFAHLQQGTDPWVAIGDLLDDWYFRAPTNDARMLMVRDEIGEPRDAADTR